LHEPVSPELLHLQVKLAAHLPYRQAAALLQELLPETGGLNLNYATTRNRTLAVGKRIEEERSARKSIIPEPVERMVVRIDGAFIKAGHTQAGQRHQFEILTGRVETSQRGGEAFAVVLDWATGPVYRASFSTGGTPPDPQVFTGLDLSAERQERCGARDEQGRGGRMGDWQLISWVCRYFRLERVG
jgi:hypothetical protein